MMLVKFREWDKKLNESPKMKKVSVILNSITICGVIFIILSVIPIKKMDVEALGDIIPAHDIIDKEEISHLRSTTDHNAISFHFTTLNNKKVDTVAEYILSRIALKGKEPEYKDYQETDQQTDQEHIQYYEALRKSAAQKTAIAALNAAGITVEYTTDVSIGVVYGNYKTAKELKVGDVIVEVDGQRVLSHTHYLELKKSWNIKYGDTHDFLIRRGDEKIHIPITYTEQIEGTDSFLTGIEIFEDIKTDLVAPDKLIHFEDFEGDSASLMTALEIYQEISGEDLTKGRRIAGTGNIEFDGSVGEIGGMDRKIRTADKNKVDVYLVPKFRNRQNQPNWTYDLSNEKQAIETWKLIDSKMKIIPVASIQEAISELRKL
jgi:PDZ domain-containing protein